MGGPEGGEGPLQGIEQEALWVGVEAPFLGAGWGTAWLTSGSYDIVQSSAFSVLSPTSFVHSMNICLAPTMCQASKTQQRSKQRTPHSHGAYLVMESGSRC